MLKAIGTTFHFTISLFESIFLALVLIGAGLFVAGKFGVVYPLSAFVILSGSMAPTVPVGGVIVTQPRASYAIGEVITFTLPGSKVAVTHRIDSVETPSIQSSETMFVTKGDANKTADHGRVAGKDIQGKVIFTVPYLGYIIDFAKTPKGFITLVIIPATIIIYEELKAVRKELASALTSLIVRFQRSKEKKTDLIYSIPGIRTPLIPGISLRSFSLWAAIVPVVAATFIFAGVAGAYFLDGEKSTANILGAASSYGEQSASIYVSDPFTCDGGASDTAGSTFGFLVIKRDNTNLQVDVQLSGVLPNTTYDLWINQDPGGCPLPSPTVVGAILTDGSGNGNTSQTVPSVVGATNFWISMTTSGQTLRSVAVLLP